MRSWLLLAALVAALPARVEPANVHRAPGKARTPVLVEMFTSEGCSSCPAADANLIQLVREQPLDGVELIGMEEHVDYWNDLGWADPFSSPLFTQRQEAFLRAVGRDGMFTPQAVIDGRADAVGSDRAGLLKAAARAAAEPHGAVALTLVRRDAHALELRAEATGLGPGRAELWIALCEDALLTQVSRGENAGRSLPHAGVVRALVKVAATEERSAAASLAGTASISVDPAWSAAHLRPIAFVQDPASRRVLATGEL